MSEARATTELRERLSSLDREVERMEREGYYGKERQEKALKARVAGDPWKDWDQWNPAPRATPQRHE